jgi:hypothetical protein
MQSTPPTTSQDRMKRQAQDSKCPLARRGVEYDLSFFDDFELFRSELEAALERSERAAAIAIERLW